MLTEVSAAMDDDSTIAGEIRGIPDADFEFVVDGSQTPKSERRAVTHGDQPRGCQADLHEVGLPASLMSDKSDDAAPSSNGQASIDESLGRLMAAQSIAELSGGKEAVLSRSLPSEHLCISHGVTLSPPCDSHDDVLAV